MPPKAQINLPDAGSSFSAERGWVGLAVPPAAACDPPIRIEHLPLLKGGINMHAVQLTAFGNPVDGLEYVDMPEPDAPGPNQVLIGIESRTTSVSHGAPTHSALRFKPSSGMKASAGLSP
jgi:hypothetical protein